MAEFLRKFRPTKGVVAAGDVHTTSAGTAMLKEGGNAIDAAVAASFVSFLSEPALTSAGGSGFAILRKEGSKEVVLYDFFSRFPGLGRNHNKKVDFKDVVADFGPTKQIFHIGKASVAVPGAIKGLYQIHEEAGKLPFDVVISPAIEMAKEGCPISNRQAFIFSVLKSILLSNDEMKSLFAPKGHLLREGEYFRNQKLAETFELLAKEGPYPFYEGEIARKFANHFEDGGLITYEDLKQYRVIKRKPFSFNYRDKRIHTNPPPSSGGTLVAFCLSLLQRLADRLPPYKSLDYLKLLVELITRMNIFRKNDFDPHNSKNILNERLIDYYATLNLNQGTINNPHEGPENTTHKSVMDEYGNAIGITISNGENSAVTIPDTGIILNNFLGEEDISPGGFEDGKPGETITSMMAPTLVEKDDKIIAVLGTGGSNRIRTAILQCLINILDNNLAPDSAVNSSRIHVEGAPPNAELYIETFDLDDQIRLKLFESLKGYRVTEFKLQNMFFGGVNMVVYDPSSGFFGGAGDRRRDGVVEVID